MFYLSGWRGYFATCIIGSVSLNVIYVMYGVFNNKSS